MKMAENSELTFDNNCATNNRNSAEVNENLVKDEENHVTNILNINSSQNEKTLNSSDVCTQEEAAEEFLAGGNKWDSENDQHLSETYDEIEDENSMKSDIAPECGVDEDLEDQKCEETCDSQEGKLAATYAENDENSTCESLEKENSNR